MINYAYIYVAYYAFEITDYALKQCSKFLPIMPQLCSLKTVLQSLSCHLGSISYQASDL